jgi:hypothetical protein
VPAPAYNPGVHKALVDAELAGLSRRSCAAKAGISPRIYWKWLERGRMALEAREEGADVPAEYVQYVDLYVETERARALWEESCLQNLNDPEEKQYWVRNAWQLERRMPDEYSLTTTVRHQGEIEHKTTVELPEETQKKMLEAFAEMTRPKELPRGDG